MSKVLSKVLAITWKELYTTFRDRNLVLIMFITPIILSTIMGLVFGGLGGDGGTSSFQNLPIAVVNLDEGLNLGDQLADGDQGEALSLNDLTFDIGGETVSVGEQLQLNSNLNITDTDLQANNVDFSFGTVLADILLSQTVTETETVTGTETAATEPLTGTAELTQTAVPTGFSIDTLSCPLTAEDTEEGSTDGDGDGDGDGEAEEGDAPFGFTGTLDDLLDAVALTDPDEARRRVDSGEFVAAVIIPINFTQQLLPSFDFVGDGSEIAGEDLAAQEAGRVEVYASQGSPISASIVRAVVEGIANQLVRISVALDSVLSTAVDQLLGVFNVDTLSQLDLSSVDPALFTNGIQSLDASILNPLACLVVPDAGNVTLDRQPLDELQTQSGFSFIMVILGSAQAIFFAMFTGIFGINSIYEERQNWTLQRIIASPTPRWAILMGKLIGNVVVVMVQLLILFASFTVIASLVEGDLSFIFGSNLPAFLLVVLGISLFVSGLGVLVVGLAKSPEQVQFFGPMISATLGALGGSFGFRLPDAIASISPVWWGSEALLRLSTNEINTLGTPLLVLFGFGVGAFLLGTLLFRRRLDL